jgi:hypothetical protein
VNPNKLFPSALAAAVGLGAILTTGLAHAINFGDFMNPGRWFGGDRDRDRYYDGYYGGPYGRWGGGPYGWGGPYGGWGGPYGYGGGPWGYGPYGGGWGGYPGYGPGSTIVVTPQGSGSKDAAPPPQPRLPE